MLPSHHISWGLKLGEHVVLFQTVPSLSNKRFASVSEPGTSNGLCLLKQYYRSVHRWQWASPFSVVGVWCSTKLRLLKCIVRYIYDCGFHVHSTWQSFTWDPQLCKERRVHSGSFLRCQRSLGLAFPYIPIKMVVPQRDINKQACHWNHSQEHTKDGDYCCVPFLCVLGCQL